MMNTENLFIVDPFNAPFVRGESGRPPDYLTGAVFAVIVLFILPMIALNMLVVEALTQAEGDVTGSLILVVLVMLTVDLILLGAAWWFWRRYSLRRHGELIGGYVVRTHGEVRPGPQGNEYVVTVWYRFDSPRSGKSITGTIALARNDLAETSLPQADEPVAILYHSDRNYRVM
ncbi:MAG: hypothetical protein EA396_07785 [Anaerolineaceae bacterium]|nr:MAG: hypothetical protein EA396_07785 [Anaerolineaceae bacterium]